jgi:hypothetical protein
MLQAMNIPAGVVLHLMEPALLPGRQAAVCPQALLGGLDARLFSL